MIDEIRADDLRYAVFIEIPDGDEGPDEPRVDHRAAIRAHDFDRADDIEFAIIVDIVRHDIRSIRMIQERQRQITHRCTRFSIEDLRFENHFDVTVLIEVRERRHEAMPGSARP